MGPILFILYIKALQKIAAKYGLDLQLYADDSQLYISFQPNRVVQFIDVQDRTNKCLAEIKAWMVNNFMKLNETKTELLVLGKSHVLKKCELGVRLQFGSTEIRPTECKGDSWKSLGVKFDESLNMERQINNVKRKCSWTMMNLRSIGRYLDEGIKLMLVKQLVISYKKAHILPIDQRIFFKVCLLTHKSVHGTAPGTVTSKHYWMWL